MLSKGILGTVAILSGLVVPTDRLLGQSTGPDIVAGDIWGSIVNWGKTGDITGYSLGTIACNKGNAEVSWVATNNQHPLQATHLYRLKSGRFEQIGLCWPMHEFLALAYDDCNLGCITPDPYTGLTLGVRCSNPDNANINGKQTRLGPRGHVNAYTGYFPYPSTSVPYPPLAPYDARIGRRLQVHDADLDPAQNPSASYFAEIQYIAPDDATAGNGGNNVSYRPVTVTDVGGGIYNLAVTGNTVAETPAIHAWKTADSSVLETPVQVPSDGRFLIAAKATDLGRGSWHYEYAVYNMTSDRSGQSFFVPVPAGVSVANIGFHDVDYHSGDSDPYAPGAIRGTDWPASRTADGVVWQTDTWNPQDRQANALRWGTVYNFRFDADEAPATGIAIIGLYKPGTQPSVWADTVVPYQPVGACCIGYTACVADTSAASCAMLGGTWQGNGTSCNPNNCPQPPTGACCDLNQGLCQIMTFLDCVGPSYIYQGDDTTCASNPCAGACCLQDETCLIAATASSCAAVNGFWKGIGSQCGEVDCADKVVPAVSEWGNGALSLLLLLAGAALFRRWGPFQNPRSASDISRPVEDNPNPLSE